MFLLNLVLLAALMGINAMPYQVPLQGNHSGKRTLVILDNMGAQQSHSMFFDELSKRGHLLSYFQAESAELILKKFGEYLYDNIVFFAPSAEDFSAITFDDITDFTSNGGNILMAVNGEMSDSVRGFAETCGVEFDSKSSSVIDHFMNEPSADPSLQGLAVLSGNCLKDTPILGSYCSSSNQASVMFRGIGHSVDESNILATRVLRGNPTTYSSNPAKPIDDAPETAGANTLLVTALQARNNARIVITGSIDMFSNTFFRTRRSASAGGEAVFVGNEMFCASLSRWVFGESGVLRFRDIIHNKLDGGAPELILHEKERPDLPQSLYPDPEITRNSLVYRIKDDIVYSMMVEQLEGDAWVPFVSTDMQMEFMMLDPYVRMTMTVDPLTGRHVASFIAPDSYGIFKFRVFYRRVGYSVLHAETQVSIRPFKHNEYERFIFSAYPYYSSAFSAMIAFFVFSMCFLFSEDKGAKSV